MVVEVKVMQVILNESLIFNIQRSLLIKRQLVESKPEVHAQVSPHDWLLERELEIISGEIAFVLLHLRREKQSQCLHEPDVSNIVRDRQWG
jgi:hypothetical protein